MLSLIVITTTLPLSAWFGSDNASSNFATGALTGAGIGGLVGGGRGAGYGALAGGMIGLATTKSGNDNYNTTERNYNRNSRTSMQQYINELEHENQNFMDDNYNLLQRLNPGASKGYAPRQPLRGNYNPKSKTSMRQYIGQLERENQSLRDEQYNLMQQTNQTGQGTGQIR